MKSNILTVPSSEQVASLASVGDRLYVVQRGRQEYTYAHHTEEEARAYIHTSQIKLQQQVKESRYML